MLSAISYLIFYSQLDFSVYFQTIKLHVVPKYRPNHWTYCITFKLFDWRNIIIHVLKHESTSREIRHFRRNMFIVICELATSYEWVLNWLQFYIFLLNPLFLADNLFPSRYTSEQMQLYFVCISYVLKYVINDSGEVIHHKKVCHGLFVLFWCFVFPFERLTYFPPTPQPNHPFFFGQY